MPSDPETIIPHPGSGGSEKGTDPGSATLLFGRHDDTCACRWLWASPTSWPAPTWSGTPWLPYYNSSLLLSTLPALAGGCGPARLPGLLRLDQELFRRRTTTLAYY
jgi:hypothetical protein